MFEDPEDDDRKKERVKNMYSFFIAFKYLLSTLQENLYSEVIQRADDGRY